MGVDGEKGRVVGEEQGLDESLSGEERRRWNVNGDLAAIEVMGWSFEGCEEAGEWRILDGSRPMAVQGMYDKVGNGRNRPKTYRPLKSAAWRSDRARVF
eukprot:CAMPEP_0184689166 /NCGR_PEP_ID=MMETSP0312-20130426/30506_1 /TAXON_ID=31354 /ORGANISM="Compsopogon coeruleus, Strain SAG 36.94" /LENGTH=98 /DNA_ID=CAMNT_0027146485 /DNA_START=215 /DNA_END=512 /DNA_ORIENTATION=-